MRTLNSLHRAVQFLALAAMVLLMHTVAPAQVGSPSGAELRWQSELLSAKSWKLQWTRSAQPDWQMPGEGRAHFEIRDGRLHEVLQNAVLQQGACTNPVELREDGFTTQGCTKVPKQWTHDPADAAWPFKGTSDNGYIYRMQPVRD